VSCLDRVKCKPANTKTLHRACEAFSNLRVVNPFCFRGVFVLVVDIVVVCCHFPAIVLGPPLGIRVRVLYLQTYFKHIHNAIYIYIYILKHIEHIYI
jgi:hypothetical protein